MPSKKDLLKPSGYDVVIRNRNRIQDLNRRLRRLKRPELREPLIDEKDRLLHEMWLACPHDSVAQGAAQLRTPTGPMPQAMRFCTSCGECESARKGRYKLLTRRKGRTIVRLDDGAFPAKLGATLRWTGINI